MTTLTDNCTVAALSHQDVQVVAMFLARYADRRADDRSIALDAKNHEAANRASEDCRELSRLLDLMTQR